MSRSCTRSCRSTWGSASTGASSSASFERGDMATTVNPGEHGLLRCALELPRSGGVPSAGRTERLALDWIAPSSSGGRIVFTMVVISGPLVGLWIGLRLELRLGLRLLRLRGIWVLHPHPVARSKL